MLIVPRRRFDECGETLRLDGNHAVQWYVQSIRLPLPFKHRQRCDLVQQVARPSNPLRSMQLAADQCFAQTRMSLDTEWTDIASQETQDPRDVVLALARCVDSVIPYALQSGRTGIDMHPYAASQHLSIAVSRHHSDPEYAW